LRLSTSFSTLELETTQESANHQSEDSTAFKVLTNMELSTSTSLGDKFKRLYSRDSTNSPTYLRLKYEFEQTIAKCSHL
jgi:hypothetical protein